MPGNEDAEKERRLFLASCGLWFFLSGIDYSIVIPTVHHYMNEIQAEPYYMGLVISALSFGALISAPIYAKITDKIQSAKYILRVGILFSIVGNCIYFLKKDKYFLVIARFISGVGWGLEGALMGQIGRTYKTSSKTGAFALVLMMRQLGVVTGPLCIFLLPHLTFSKRITQNFELEVTKYSAVGLFLASAWTVVWVLVVFLYNDPPPEVEDDINNNELLSRENSFRKSAPQNASSKKRFRASKKVGLLHEPIVVASCSTFSTYVLQSGMETLITPFTHWYFGWNERQNAFMYISVGLTALLGYFSMQFVSRKWDDRQTLLLGCSFCSGVLLMILIIFPLASFRAQWIYPLFGLGMLVFCWFLPYVVTSAAAILSKSASEEDQSVVQSIRTTGEVLAQILSPLWVGFTLHRTDIVLIFQLIFMSLCLFFTISSWKMLKPEEVIPYKSAKTREELGFEPMIIKTRSHIFDLDDHAASRASLPSSVICSLNSLVKQS